MRYIRGTKKNVLLTVWLSLPFVFLGVMVYGIFSAYSGGRAMDARPVGQGGGDTGGANALGEWLAGHDVAAEERIQRDLREGRLIDPIDWEAGIVLSLNDPISLHRRVWVVLWHGKGSGIQHAVLGVGPEQGESTMEPPEQGWKSPVGSVVIRHEALEEMFRDGRPGAGIYLAGSRTVTEVGGRLVDADGRDLVPVEIHPVPASLATAGEPITVRVDIEAD